MTITIEQANTYFATHLQSSKWSALTTARKTAAITMAEQDILALLSHDEIDGTNSNIRAAVCEQALFLALNIDDIEKFRNISAESIDGFGSATYAARTRFDGMSRRAMQFIAQEIGGGTVRLSRG